MKGKIIPFFSSILSLNNCVLFVLVITLDSCGQVNEKVNTSVQLETGIQRLINPEGKVIEERFLLPDGYKRITVDEKSFEMYLRKLLLKPDKSKVFFYNGKVKEKDVYDAVVDLQIGNKDLHQCADAVLRLRAEYLFKQGLYDKIHFNFTNGFRADYSEWIKGKQIIVNGNNVSWKQRTDPSNTYDDFWQYLEVIFTYAGTLSLNKELKSVSIDDIKIGDIFIKGGSPGHAVIVVDMAINEETNKKIFLLAQSYMPAQEIQVLKNPNDEKLSPWYSEDFGEILVTPEWTFKKEELKRFE